MTKIELIEKALNDPIISLDVEFIRTCRERMQNEKQWDAILQDISVYRSSGRCKTYVQCDNMINHIRQWSDWRFITLTFEPSWRKWRTPIARNATENVANEARYYVLRWNEELTKRILGKTAVRKGQRVRMVAKPGGDADLINLHYHAIVEVPPTMDIAQFDHAVEKSWCHGTTDARRDDDNLEACCMYLLQNEQQLNGKIDAELFNVNILHTFKK